jgi:hypothetical protein
MGFGIYKDSSTRCASQCKPGHSYGGDEFVTPTPKKGESTHCHSQVLYSVTVILRVEAFVEL